MDTPDQKPRCAWPSDQLRKKNFWMLEDYRRCCHGETGEVYRSEMDGRDYCLFHLPLEDKRDRPDLTEKFREKFIEQIGKPTPLRDFQGFQFPDNFKLNEHDFRPKYERNGRKPADREKVDRLNFDLVVFGKNVSLEGCSFGNVAFFRRARCLDFFDIKRTWFGDFASFWGAEFSDEASFNGARFGDWTRFSFVRFGYSARFDGARFGNQAAFREAHFGNQASFWRTQFGHEANFIEARLGKSANFRETRFGDWANFGKAYFSEMAGFDRAQFGDAARFIQAQFGEMASFAGARFGDETLFDLAQFQGRVDFTRLSGQQHTRLDATRFEVEQALQDTYKIAFQGRISGRLAEPTPPDLSFHRTEFQGPAKLHYDDLSRTRFHHLDLKYVSFLHSQIAQTRFVSCEWNEDLENEWFPSIDPCWGIFYRQFVSLYPFRCLDYVVNPDFWHDIFNWLSPVTKRLWRLIKLRPFRRPRVMFDEQLWRAKQTGIPICIEKEQYDLSHFNIDPQSVLPSDIEVLALQMKESLERTKDPIPAGDFHFAAMEMKRHQAIEGQNQRLGLALGLWLYKMLNGYGERPGRTFIWFLFTIGIATGLSLIFDPLKNFGQSLFWSIQHSLPFKFASAVVLDFNAIFPGTVPGNEFIHWLGLGETFVGTALFTFFVLALRRRFKR